jgi:PTH2 family peptidyl-tRNA hydrolase
VRTYIFMRRDLKMRRGKEIAQACHAVLGLGVEDQATVTLQAANERDLVLVSALALEKGWPCYSVRDAGRTEVEPGTVTCTAISAPEGTFEAFALY